MPRCYMVKKGALRLEAPPPCSPTEASVAPPYYNPGGCPPLITEPQSAQYAEPQTAQYDDDTCTENYTECTNSCSDTLEIDFPEGQIEEYTVVPVSDYEETSGELVDASGHPNCKESSSPQIQSMNYDTFNNKKTSVYESEYVKHPDNEYEQQSVNETTTATFPELQTGYRAMHNVEYTTSQMEPANMQFAEPQPTHITVCSDMGQPRAVQYTELQNMATISLCERSEADTEAAHELLSLAQSVPPLPPATMLTVLRAPEPVLPVYTYTIQPTNIIIIAEESPEPNIYTTVQTIAPIQQVEYATIEPQVNYVAYQEAPLPRPMPTLPPPLPPLPPLQQHLPPQPQPLPTPPIEYQPIFHEPEQPPLAVHVPVVEPIPLAVPVSVIEATPTPMTVVEHTPAPVTVPASVQVPVIEEVPQVQQAQVQPDSPALLTTESTSESASENETEVKEKEPDYVCKKAKYLCLTCGKRYATSSNLSRHKQTHRSLDSQEAKRCPECGKAYVSMPALAMHVLTHRMGHVCCMCGKQFSRPWLLRGHLRSHTGEKPYKCQYCRKSFADRSNLRAHLQTHSSDKKWECLRCNKTFALKSYLSKHQETVCSREDD